METRSGAAAGEVKGASTGACDGKSDGNGVKQHGLEDSDVAKRA